MSGRLPASLVPRKPRQFEAPIEATVRSVTAAGVLFSRAGDPSVELGPARWQRPVVPVGVPSTPPAGTACLVLYADSGAASPWVVAFDGWPL